MTEERCCCCHPAVAQLSVNTQTQPDISVALVTKVDLDLMVTALNRESAPPDPQQVTQALVINVALDSKSDRPVDQGLQIQFCAC